MKSGMLGCFFFVVQLIVGCLLGVSELSVDDFPRLDPNVRYLLLDVDRLDLVDRLGFIVDWHIMAEASSRQLLLSWRPSKTCNATFLDLFSQWPSSVGVLSPALPILSEAMPFLKEATQNQQLTFDVLDDARTSATEDERNAAIFDVLSSNIQLLFVTASHNSFSPRPKDMPCRLWNYQRAQLLASLQPISSIQETADALYRSLFDTSLLIGIYIHLPTETQQTTKQQEQQGIERFLRLIQKIWRHFDTVGDLDSSSENAHSKSSTFLDRKPPSWVRFLVTSNSATLKSQILLLARQNQYFTRAHSSPNAPSTEPVHSNDELPLIILQGAPDESVHSETVTSSVEAVRLAFVEWLLFVKSSLILSTAFDDTCAGSPRTGDDQGRSRFVAEASTLAAAIAGHVPGRAVPVIYFVTQTGEDRDRDRQGKAHESDPVDAVSADDERTAIREGTRQSVSDSADVVDRDGYWIFAPEGVPCACDGYGVDVRAEDGRISQPFRPRESCVLRVRDWGFDGTVDVRCC